MLFTWIVAMNMWMMREDTIDPWREQETASPKVIELPRVPNEPKALVA